MDWINTPSPYQDEALESYLLRLSDHLGFLEYADFAEEIWALLVESTPDAFGSYPLSLHQANICHAKVASKLRAQGLLFIGRQRGVEESELLKLALMHSKTEFSPNYKAAFRDGVDYPFTLLRKEHTPVCPECLAESPYIRQHWQFLPHQVCHRHQVRLLTHCPSCCVQLDYQSSESITYCECDFDLTTAKTTKAEDDLVTLSQWLLGEHIAEEGILAFPLGISERYGVLLWYTHRYGDEEHVDLAECFTYFKAWPEPLYTELDQALQKGEAVRVQPWNKTPLSVVYGNLVKEARNLPSRDVSRNPILKAIVAYLSTLVNEHAGQHADNPSNMLVSTLEASTLLGCTIDEVNRLNEHGYLQTAFRLKLHQKIESYKPIYRLRDLMTLRLTHMQSSTNGLNVFLPEW
ncbi:TniQ family protein [Enterovibrio paralichthyis]|uniref:TniQ family protein n=1 Tax=Enterovibrio paralichthyis TaxID=2853805 RepID=UPI001C445582|nr:TniQ family protein [Enterovibrio paralichthyis]MBV7297288.1 TniQ family protein [Enterovibrio paralichthyis]